MTDGSSNDILPDSNTLFSNNNISISAPTTPITTPRNDFNTNNSSSSYSLNNRILSSTSISSTPPPPPSTTKNENRKNLLKAFHISQMIVNHPDILYVYLLLLLLFRMLVVKICINQKN